MGRVIGIGHQNFEKIRTKNNFYRGEYRRAGIKGWSLYHVNMQWNR